ncbi:MAG TPA: porin, partial [Candidatus Paceibacterota bacterium]|nr:porin [Candidatus Paceibacterota bacterium]
MKKNVILIGLILGVAGWRVAADETSDAISALKQQIQALDQKVRVLERQKELDKEAAAEKAKTTPKVVVGGSGLSVSSADTNFVFQLHGLVQIDNRTFFGESKIKGNDGFLVRRARPIFSGTVARDFDFMFVPEFGGSSPQIYDAYLNYRYQPWLQLRAGRFKVPVGLEYLQADPVTSFTERSLVSALVPGRDVGFQLWGDTLGGRLSYAVGVFNGVGDGANSSNSDFEDHREIAARLFAQPFKKSDAAALKGIGFGVGGSWGNVSSNSTGLPNKSGYATDGQQQFFSYTNGVAAAGDHWRVSPQAYWYFGPLSVMSEYALSKQEVRRNAAKADLTHTAWQVSVGYVLTGEDASYTGVTPKHPFNPSEGGWGAFQIVGRYAELDIDNDTFPTFAGPNVSATDAQAWAVGLNW